MRKRHIAGRYLLSIAAFAILLAGCGSNEDRISAAVPVGKDVEASKAALDAAAKTLNADTSALEADYAAQLKIRVLECAKGYEAPLFASEDVIRNDIGNADCFKAADAKLLNWLGLRRAGWLAAMPPLRKASEGAAAVLPAPGRITAFAFADKAGVAVLKSYKAYVVMDLSGNQIRKDDDADSQFLSLSPNGRLLVLGRVGEARIVDTESGESLFTIPNLRGRQVFWVGSQGLIYAPENDGAVFRDFANGEERKVPLSSGQLAAVVSVPGHQNKYVLLSQRRFASMQVEPGSKGDLRFTMEGNLPAYIGWDTIPTAAHGRLAFGNGNQLYQLDLASMAIDTLNVSPLFVARVMPTAEPDRLLVSLRGSGFDFNSPHLLSPTARTLAKVQTTTMLSNRLIYLPSINRNAMIDDEKIVVLDTLQADAPANFEAVAESAKFEAQLAQLDTADLRERLRGSQNSLAAVSRPTQGGNFGVTTASPSRGTAANVNNGPNYPYQSPPKIFPPGEAGLREAIRAGVLRLGGPGDLETWKEAYASKQGHPVRSDLAERFEHQEIYVVTGDMVIPAGLHGAHSVIFIVERRAPFPQGDPGHSMILDINSGACSGALCWMGMR